MLRISLVTPERKLFTDLEVEDVYIPGFKGELNVLVGHSPLITTLEPGTLKYRPKGETKFRHVALSWGYCEVYMNHVSVLAETAEFPEEIDLDRAKTELGEANELLVKGFESPEDFDKTLGKVNSLHARIEVFDTRDISKIP